MRRRLMRVGTEVTRTTPCARWSAPEMCCSSDSNSRSMRSAYSTTDVPASVGRSVEPVRSNSWLPKAPSAAANRRETVL